MGMTIRAACEEARKERLKRLETRPLNSVEGIANAITRLDHMLRAGPVSPDLTRLTEDLTWDAMKLQDRIHEGRSRDTLSDDEREISHVLHLAVQLLEEISDVALLVEDNLPDDLQWPRRKKALMRRCANLSAALARHAKSDGPVRRRQRERADDHPRRGTRAREVLDTLRARPDTFQFQPKDSNVIHRLRQRGVKIESATEARAAGKKIPAAAKGWRIAT